MEDQEDREYALWFADAYDKVMTAKEKFGVLFRLGFLLGTTESPNGTLEEMEEISGTLRSVAEEMESRGSVPAQFIELHSGFRDVVTHLSSAVTLTTDAYVAMDEGDEEGMRDKIEQASEEVKFTTEAEKRLRELLTDLR